jgi:hypothetical protein
MTVTLVRVDYSGYDSNTSDDLVLTLLLLPQIIQFWLPCLRSLDTIINILRSKLGLLTETLQQYIFFF